VMRHGSDGLRVVGRVSATVEQTCVVTLERLSNEVEEDIDLVFAPPRLAKPKFDASQTSERTSQKTCLIEGQGEPEPLIGGVVDLGALATEFLVLGLDPYPRKPGAVFHPQQNNGPQQGPFSVLAQLTKGRDGN
jgi:Large ribosomal RNA subunit accumulation protein YceD